MEKVDRRVQRTRELLRSAILSLIEERGFDTLRIEDITDRANLRRATFYMHYKDREELLLSALASMFDELAQEAEHVSKQDGWGGKTQSEAYLVTFRHAEQHATLYRNILSSQSGALFSRQIRDYLAHLILQALLAHPVQASKVPPVVLANYIAGAELGMITWWLENYQPYPAEQMAGFIHQMVLNGAVTPLSGD